MFRNKLKLLYITLSLLTSLGCIHVGFGQDLANNLRYTPMTPCRILDTRNYTAAYGGQLLLNETRPLPISQSCGLGNVTMRAVALNITVVPVGAPANVSLWPSGQPKNPNFVAINNPNQRIIAQNAIVPTDTAGSINAFSTGPTHIIIDVNGYFSPNSSGLAFYPITPCRVKDTRVDNTILGAMSTRDYSITQSPCGIPGNAQAFFLNTTVVPSGLLGYLTIFPTGVVPMVIG